MAVTFNPFTGTFDFTGSSGGGGTIGGSIANTQVAFGTAANTIGGSANLVWDGSALKINTSTAAVATNKLSFFAATTSAELAGVISDETGGSGVLVFNASPTIVTPTIASFTNATHTHLNAAGGGTLTAAAVTDLNSATITFTNKSGNISQWTNDSGYLTSVTAHNVLSATHGDTLTASVVRGDLIIGNSTPKWSRLAVGAASSVVVSDGTDVSWSTGPTVITATASQGLAANTSGDGFILTNPTAAPSSGNQQFSPRIRLTGQGWKTTATAGSQTVDWLIENEPQQGTTSPGTRLVFRSQVNGGGYTTRMYLDDGGGVDLGGGSIQNCFQVAATQIRVTTGATLQGNSTGLTVCSASTLGFSSASNNATSGPDAQFTRDAADIIAQARAANAQTFRVYGTTTGSKYSLLKHDGTDGTLDVSSGKLILGGTASDIQWGKALVALGGGAAPTLGTIGGSGPASAAQNTWMQVKDSTGAAFWVPAWK